MSVHTNLNPLEGLYREMGDMSANKVLTRTVWVPDSEEEEIPCITPRRHRDACTVCYVPNEPMCSECRCVTGEQHSTLCSYAGELID